MRQGNLEVFIKSEGRELPECHVENIDHQTLACYIPSEVGKTFDICWRGDTQHDEHDTSVECYVDGRSAGRSHCNRGIVDQYRWGLRVAIDRRRPFTFTSLATTDDDTAAGLEAYSDLGTIEVKLVHVLRVGTLSFKADADGFQPGMVHERSKKMGVQCVSLGDGRKCAPLNKVRSRPVNQGVPYARYVFRYRSKEFLQAEGIMPWGEERAANDKQEQVPVGRKRRAAHLHPETSETGRRPKREGTMGAASPPQQDVKPSLAGSEDVGLLRDELISDTARTQSNNKGRVVKASSRSPGLKRERRDNGEDVVDLTGSDVKNEHSCIRLDFIGGIIDLTHDDDQSTSVL